MRPAAPAAAGRGGRGGPGGPDGRPASRRLADGAVVTALVGLALAPAAALFSPAALVRPALGGLAAGAAVAAVAAWRRWPPLFALAAAA
ncbi:MAG: hypothetical protein LBD70_03130, partial [Bifidobacteriaceae bacterium]|nr:hypothetical protein [Bifidobacteriaceae bacterium]